MRISIFIFIALFASLKLHAQQFEVIGLPETVQSTVGKTIKIPIRVKNNTDKSQLFIIRLGDSDFRATQKGYFCIDGDCLEAGIPEISRKIEPGVTLSGLHFTLETGLVAGQNLLRFDIMYKGGGIKEEMPLTINIDEEKAKNIVFQSKDITIRDLYPNPVSSLAFIDYELYNERTEAKIVIHNILGSAVGEQEMPFSEQKAKISTEEMAPGIYFYTIYVDNEGVITRKLVVKR